VTEQQWLKIYRETVHPLYGYMARRTGGNQELTEDIVQESFLKALDGWNRKAVPDSPLAWLKRAARNILIDYLRRKRRDRQLDLNLPSGTGHQTSVDPLKSLEVYAAISSLGRKKAKILLKKAHLESAQEMESRAKIQLSNGLIRDEEYLAMKQGADRAGLELERSLLNLDEVKMSGETPRNELSAPLVGGCDFVSERLEIERKEVELDMELFGRRLDRIKQLLEKGLVQGVQLEQVQAEVAARKVMVDKIQQRLDLRKHFSAGEITGREVEIQDRKAVVEKNLRLAQSKVDSLKEQLKRLQLLEAKGVISPSESREVKYALTTAEAELQLAALEMQALEKVE
jgi:RNA polymerase sigma-70 factor (ECF subfamily)